MPEKHSRVLAFMHERIENLDFDPDDEPGKKITVRLSQSLVNDLDAVAAKLSFTRTGCAEHLLSVCIREAAIYVTEDPIVAARSSFDPKLLARIEDASELVEA